MRIFVAIAILLSGCGGAQKRAESAVSAITSVADPLYAALVDGCAAAESLLVDQATSDIAKGADRDARVAELRADIAQVREPCTAAALAFEAARAAQQAAIDAAIAADLCDPSDLANCVQAAIDAADSARRAAQAAADAHKRAMEAIR